jgi:hypothetical protein
MVAPTVNKFTDFHASEDSLSYSGRKIPASFGNVTVRGEKDGKGNGEARWRRVCLSMYSVKENIYYSQLSSVELQPAA